MRCKKNTRPRLGGSTAGLRRFGVVGGIQSEPNRNRLGATNRSISRWNDGSNGKTTLCAAREATGRGQDDSKHLENHRPLESLWAI